MSELETVQGFYAGAKAGDMDQIRSVLAPKISWRQTPGFPNAATFTTPDEMLAGVFGTLGEEWDGFRGVPEEFVVDGDRVVVLGFYAGTSKETGRSFQAPFAHAFRVRDGVIVEMQQYTDTKLIHDAWRD